MKPPLLKRRSVFVHRKWLDEDYTPLHCRVTAIVKGEVYWRNADGTGGAMHFPLADAEKYVREIIAY